jgi:hypothetical protein
MCNDSRLRLPTDALFEAFSEIRVPLRWAEGQASNLEPRDDIRIRDTAPVVGRTTDGRQAVDDDLGLARATRRAGV